MPDQELIKEKLQQVLDALNRICDRISLINSPDDFHKTPENMDKLDAIAMMLIATGETFKKIDRDTFGELLKKYPSIDWKGIKGIRDVLAHNYFDIDTEQIFLVCKKNVPVLIQVVEKMIREIHE